MKLINILLQALQASHIVGQRLHSNYQVSAHDSQSLPLAEEGPPTPGRATTLFPFHRPVNEANKYPLRGYSPYKHQAQKEVDMDFSQTAVFKTFTALDEERYGTSYQAGVSLPGNSVSNACSAAFLRMRRALEKEPVSVSAQLLSDPITFLRHYRLKVETSLNVQPLPREGGYAKLTTLAAHEESQYYLQYSATAEGDTVPAYFLPNNLFLPTDQAAYLDLPKNPPIGCLVVIGYLGKDSIIVREVKDRAQPSEVGLRLLRDKRENSAVLHTDVRLAADAYQYARDGFKTVALLVYEKVPTVTADSAASLPSSARWQLHLQQQSQQNNAVEHLHFIDSLEKQDSKLRQFFFNDLQTALLNKFVEVRRQMGLETRSPVRYFIDLVAQFALKKGIWLITAELLEHEFQNKYRALSLEQALLEGLPTLTAEQKKEMAGILLQLADLDKKYECVRAFNEYLRVKTVLDKQIAASASANSEEEWMSPSGERFPEAVLVRQQQSLFVDYGKIESYLLSLYDPALTEGLNRPEAVSLPRGFDKDGDVTQMKRFFVEQIATSRTPLTSAQKGAMIYYIGKMAERMQLQQDASSVGNFIDRATQLARSPVKGYTLAQGFYLSQVGDKYEGRCLPLAYTVAAAFSKGESYLENFIAKVKDAEAYPTTENAKLLVSSLALLHSDRISEQGSGIVRPAFIDESNQGVEKFGDIFAIAQSLDQVSTSASFLMSTETHAVAVGVRLESEAKKFFFYDPNFAVLIFSSIEDFRAVLHDHFISHGYADQYDARAGAFRVERLNANLLGMVRLESGIAVNDLFNRRPLTLAQEAPIDIFFDASEECLSSTEIGPPLLTLDAQSQANRIQSAFARLLKQAASDNLISVSAAGRRALLPVLADVQPYERNGQTRYRIPLLQVDGEEQQRHLHWIETNDDAFMQCKEFIEKNIKQVAKAYVFEQGQFKSRLAVPQEEAINGLNSLTAVQALFQQFSRGGMTEQGNAFADDANTRKLGLALQAHTYWNWLQIAEGTRQDFTNAAHLLQSLVQTEKAGAVASVNAATTSLARTFTRALNVAVSTGLSLGNIVLDAYEVAHAQTSQQRAVFATQLGFDVTSFLMSTASSASGMIGGSATTASAATMLEASSGVGTALASEISGGSAGLVGGVSVAEVLGPLAVPVAGLGIGFTALAKTYGQIADEVRAVGLYFQNLKDAYVNAGYTYHDGLKAWIPHAGAVIKTVDLVQNKVEFDSQSIYRSHHGRTGSGKINYFFWVGDFPHLVRDKAQALNIREVALQQSATSYPKAPNGEAVWQYEGLSRVMILPNTPKSYLSYKYESLPGAMTMQVSGLDLLRRLEEDEKLDVDFYIFPSEYSIRTIYQEYVRTAVDVFLDENTWRLQMPNFPRGLDNWMHYDVYARAGSQYVLGLNAGASLTLHTPLAAGVAEQNTLASATRWLLDLSTLNNDAIKIDPNQLKIGGVNIYLQGEGAKEILLIKQNGELARIDFLTQALQVIEEDGNQWPNTSETLDEHLKQMSDKHQLLSGQYIAINNFQLNQKNLGRAYFDIDQKRTLYIAADAKGKAVASPTLELAAIIGNSAYFYDTYNNFFARVEVGNGEIKAQYSRVGDFSKGKLIRVWQEGAQIFSAWQHTLRRYGEQQDQIQLIYGVAQEGGKDRPILTAIHGHTKLLDYLDDHRYLSEEGGCYLYALQGHIFLGALGDSRGGTQQRAENELNTAELLLISGKNREGRARHYWVRKHDGLIIKPNLSAPLAGQTQMSPEIPTDLLLCASFMQKAAGLLESTAPVPEHTMGEPRITSQPTEIFYFYSPKDKRLYRQVGAGTTVWEANTAAQRIDIAGLANVLNIDGKLLLVTASGLIKQIGVEGHPQLVGVNQLWLQSHAQWGEALQRLVQEERLGGGEPSTILTILGLEDATAKVLPAWWYNDHIVIAKNDLNTQALQFVGLASETQALLLATHSGRLWQQPLLTETPVNDIVLANARLKPEIEIPPASLLLDGISEISLSADKQVRLTTYDGIALQAPLTLLLTSANTFRASSEIEINGVKESNRPMLIGISAQWQTKNQAHLVNALEQLGQRYTHAEAIALKIPPFRDRSTDQTTPPSWYHFTSKQIIVAYQLTHADKPRLLDVKADKAFVFNQLTGQLLVIKQKHLLTSALSNTDVQPSLSLPGQRLTRLPNNQLLGTFAAVERRNTTLVVLNKDQEEPFHSAVIPILPSANNLIVQTGKGKHMYLFTPTAWAYYATMIIDKGHDESSAQIMLDIANPDQLIVREAQAHIFVYDPSTQKKLVVRNVLSGRAAAGSWSISTNTRKWEVASTPPRLVSKSLHRSD